MKKTIYLLSLTTILLFAFAFNVNAATYQGDELEVGQILSTGDIIEFGSGTFNSSAYDYLKLDIHRNGSIVSHGEIARDITNIRPVYSNYTFVERITVSNECYLFRISKVADFLCLDARVTDLYFTLNNNTPLISLTLHEGETKRIYVHYEATVSPISYAFYGQIHNPIGTEAFIPHYIETNDVGYVDINYQDYDFIYCYILGPDGDINNPIATSGQLDIWNTQTEKKDDSKKDREDKKEDDAKTEEESNAAPQTPSTIQNGTVQVSLGDNKGSANVKALNQYLHDSINQNILANMYAANHKKKANVLIQKNLIPPYGVQNDWKKSSHTITWKDLDVKKGDNVIVIWYTPSFFGFTSTLKYIPATVLEDGTIQFTAPSMGDMSVMSIVKLI